MVELEPQVLAAPFGGVDRPSGQRPSHAGRRDAIEDDGVTRAGDVIDPLPPGDPLDEPPGSLDFR